MVCKKILTTVRTEATRTVMEKQPPQKKRKNKKCHFYSLKTTAPITAVSLCNLKSSGLEDNNDAVFEKEVEAAVNTAHKTPNIQRTTLCALSVYNYNNTGTKSLVSTSLNAKL